MTIGPSAYATARTIGQARATQGQDAAAPQAGQFIPDSNHRQGDLP
jgi:hypothetical protein